MTELSTFVTLLESTVMAPRLSGSKVKELTDQSQRLFHEDTKLVSAYFRLNNNLPPMSQARVSSLYVFDAIARATQKAGRQGSEMLKKLEAVVGSWVSGMVDDGRGGVWVEGKDKTRKIIEIWTKSATFPPSCLDKLSTNIRSPDYEPPPPIMSPALPPEETSGTPLGGYLAGTGQDTAQPVPSRSNVGPALAAGSLPPEILKLLGASAQQSTPTRSPVDPRKANGNSLSSAPSPAIAGGIDLSSLLANVAKPIQSVLPIPGQPTSQPQAQAQPAPSAPAPAPLLLNPEQLAQLARFAQAGPGPQPFGVGAFPSVPQPHESSGPSQYREREPQPQRGPSYSNPVDYDAPSRRMVSGSRTPPRRNSRDGYDYEYDTRGPPPQARGWSDDRSSRDSRDHPDRFRGYGDRPPLPRDDRDFGRDFDSRDSRPRERSRSPIRDVGYPRREFNRAEPMGMDEARGWARESRAEPMGGGGRGRGRGRDVERGERGGRGRGGHGRGRPSEHRTYGGQADIDRRSIPVPEPTGRALLATQPGKDEFGRDLPSKPEQTEGQPEEDGGEEDMALDDSDDEKPPIPLVATSSYTELYPASLPATLPPPPQPAFDWIPQNHAVFPPTPNPSQTTLASFDRESFDFTNPGSWVALGQAFQNSTGREPNQVDLMQFIMTGEVPDNAGLGGVPGGIIDGGRQGYQDSGQGYQDGGEDRRGGYRGRGRGRGSRGGY